MIGNPKNRGGCKPWGQQKIVCVLQRNGMVANLRASGGSFVSFKQTGWLQTSWPAKDRLSPSKKPEGCKFKGQRKIVCVFQGNQMFANFKANAESFVSFKRTGWLNPSWSWTRSANPFDLLLQGAQARRNTEPFCIRPGRRAQKYEPFRKFAHMRTHDASVLQYTPPYDA